MLIHEQAQLIKLVNYAIRVAELYLIIMNIYYL